jgi:hypothetical protein
VEIDPGRRERTRTTATLVAATSAHPKMIHQSFVASAMLRSSST